MILSQPFPNTIDNHLSKKETFKELILKFSFQRSQMIQALVYLHMSSQYRGQSQIRSNLILSISMILKEQNQNHMSLGQIE